jgi:gluconolactonase
MPNGITLSTDESVLWVGGTNGLYRYSLSPGGDLSSHGQLIETEHLSSSSGIDGLGRDCLSNIYVTVHSERQVVVINAEGAELAVFEIPSAGGVTNVAFGGKDRDTLYVTSLGTPPQIHSAQLGVVGYPY